MKTQRLIFPIFLLLVLAISSISTGQAATTIGRGRIMRVSVAADGTQSDGDIIRSAFSANGQVAVFVSDATTLGGDPAHAGLPQLYAFDKATLQLTYLSVAPSGTPIDLYTFLTREIGISGDGRFVAIDSLTALVPEDTNDSQDIFVHDRLTGQTTRVSVASNGAQDTGIYYNPRLSFDGRYVIFEGAGYALVPGIGPTTGIFLHDRQTGQTEAASVATDGTQADEVASDGAISDDGRLVAFVSAADNLDSIPYPDTINVFLRDRQTGETNWVWGPPGTARIYYMDMSGDGRYFLIGTSDNCWHDLCDYSIVLYDRLGGEVIGSMEDIYLPDSDHAVLATDPIVAIMTKESLVQEDTDGTYDLYRHNFSTGESTQVTVPAFGPSQEVGAVGSVSISADGRDIIFATVDSVYVAGDTNGMNDLFLWTGDASFGYLPVIR